MKRILFISCFILAIFSSCSNKSLTFPDYKYTTVYFAYQSPVKTLVLGNDIFDNTMDNEHKTTIMATLGGVYQNNKNVAIGVSVDPSLCNNLQFGGTTKKVIAMPSNYYTLPKDMTINIPSGSVMGGLEIQLTDAFFADPLSITNTYVIPLRMNTVTNADSILSGKSELSKPDPRITGNWITVPKNYILFGVKYINPFHGNYLRRGKEAIKDNVGDTTVVYRAQYVEKDQLCSMGTLSMNKDSLLLNAKTRANVNLPFQLVLSFDSKNACTISNPSAAAYTISGSGEFVKDGDSWGDQKRDVLHLSYTVDFGTSTHTFTDTLVIRDRGVKFETFNPLVIN